MPKPTKCAPDGKSYCPAMESRLGPEHQKGLTTVSVVDLKTLRTRRVLVVYKRTARDRGLVLNHCPWCGAPIYRHKKEKS